MSADHNRMSHRTGRALPRDPSGLPEASRTESVRVGDREAIDLVARPVRMRIGDSIVRMLGYGGSIPGPTLHLRQGSEATVRFHNETDHATTVHWHGLRHDNGSDGVPEGPHRGVQPPVEPGGTHSYRLRFPDPGVFWYHPHVREDYGQEEGLYGVILVEPLDPAYWAGVDREVCLVLDDILIEDGLVAAFDASGPDHTLMGRYGNILLVNGDPHFTMQVGAGEVIRLYVVNAANTRTFDFSVPGARMKLVGGDNGRVEREQYVDDVVLAPSERAVVEVLFDQPGVTSLEHRLPDRVHRLGRVEVMPGAPGAHVEEYARLRHSAELARIRRSLVSDETRAPDKSISLVGRMTGPMTHHGTGGHAAPDPIEWEDTMAEMNRASTPANMSWAIVDDASGAQNMDIDWAFRVGDRVKLRITNSTTTDHPMQHPFHVHGQRFLVLSHNGTPNPNLVWKDTVLVPAGDTVDILIDATNPGRWMAHCHIAEHLEAGMMLTFEVTPPGSPVGEAHPRRS